MPEARTVGSLSGSLTANIHSLAARTAISAALGGTAEHLGGGKFANGAITGAYTVMFNHFLHEGNKEKGVSFKHKLMDYFNFWKNQFCLSTNYSEIYTDAYMNNSEAAQAGLEVRNAFSLAASTEISTYYSVSIGKSSSDIGGFGTLMYSSGNHYLTIGGDYTPAFSILPVSVNISGGFIIGQKNSLSGWGYGFGGGSVLGIEYSRSFDSKVKSVGMNIGTSPIWGSGSIAYSYKF